jgi:hypothetical protein
VAWPTEAFGLSGLQRPSPNGPFSPRPRAGERSPHRHRRRWPADFGGDQRQGGSGKGARATRHGEEMTGGTSERKAHWRGSFHGGVAQSEGNNSEGWSPVVVVGSSQFWEGGRGTGSHWGGVNGARGQPVKLDGGRCLAVLHALSWRKSGKLGRPGNGEVVLSGGALEQGEVVGISTA